MDIIGTMVNVTAKYTILNNEDVCMIRGSAIRKKNKMVEKKRTMHDKIILILTDLIGLAR